MCFRPASTTMGARICMKCHYVCDDVSAEKCPQCGEPFEAPAAGAPTAGGAPGAPGAPSAPGAPGAPQAPSAPPQAE